MRMRPLMYGYVVTGSREEKSSRAIISERETRHQEGTVARAKVSQEHEDFYGSPHILFREPTTLRDSVAHSTDLSAHA